MASASMSEAPMALSGVRILDFTRLGFGAQATLICGCLGAEVIRVESTTRPDPIRVMPPFVPDPGRRTTGFGSATLSDTAGAPSANRGAVFYKYNTGGKKSITVDAGHPKGLALLKQLVVASDVVTESFAAGTLERWGLSYETMREARPDVVYVSMCGFGHEGPDSSHVTMGPTAQALTGLTFLVGLPDRPPAGWTFSYLDHVGGYLGAVAILTGLLHRSRTGCGQYIDVSQLEPATALSGAILLDALVNDRPARRAGFPTGNRRHHPPTSPGGAYRAEGRRRLDRHLVPHRGAVGRPCEIDGRACVVHRRALHDARIACRQRGRPRRARRGVDERPRALRRHGCSSRPQGCRPVWCRTPPTAWSATRSLRHAGTSRCSETPRSPLCRSRECRSV